MGLTSNTGLLAVPPKLKTIPEKEKVNIELRCDVTSAPFMLRPYAGLYNPFSHGCSILCNHPAETDAKAFVRKAKDALAHEAKAQNFNEENSKFNDMYGGDKDKNKAPHDIVTEEMFRRYAETDSRPHTPAPTLASGKSRGSRRCLTPDEPCQRTAIVVDLRRSHSQETLYYHGYATSDITAAPTTSGATIDRSTLPSLNTSEGGRGDRLVKGQCEQLPPLASPLVLSKRNLPPKEASVLRTVRKNQLKALNLGKTNKAKKQSESTPVQEVIEKEINDGAETELNNLEDDEGDAGEMRRRGKRRKKGRPAGSDRLTSAGLAAQSQQDPETQIAGIGTDSHNPSSRGSVAQPSDVDVLPLPTLRRVSTKKTDSFLDDDILKYLHRDVDEEAIQTEFDTKRRYVLEEAYRTRPERAVGVELQALVRELRVPAMSLGDWLHIPRVFSRQNAHFALPLDSNALETLSPMQYAARFVTLKKSKQLLYLTVLRKFRPGGYRLPIENIGEGLTLMMGGILTPQHVTHLTEVMQWDTYEEEENVPDDIKLSLSDPGMKMCRLKGDGDGEEEKNTIKYRTWCGVCAVCERMFGRFPPRENDPPSGMELSDFTLLETKLNVLKVHSGLVEILNTIRTR